MKKRHVQKLLLLSLFLMFAFNIPLLLLFNSSDELLGLPLIYVYFFSLWLASLIISFLIFRFYDE
ncbi:MAG: hypothetical protein EOO10_23670 [Chitinophagaceae bacterium]|nr:MAG: hypothetical protein EOO10_23670 [Chitinophagaceae bacterium]